MPFTQAYAKKLASAVATEINLKQGDQVVKLHQVENFTWIIGRDFCVRVAFYKQVSYTGKPGIFVRNELGAKAPTILSPDDFTGTMMFDKNRVLGLMNL